MNRVLLSARDGADLIVCLKGQCVFNSLSAEHI